jgi:hypothetical protein
MAIHPRFTKFIAVIGALSLAGASVARAQDTSAAARTDTSAYRGNQNGADTAQAGQQGVRTDSSMTDSSGFRYNGPPTDTTLKAKPGAQTGPSAGDTSNGGQRASAAGQGRHRGLQGRLERGHRKIRLWQPRRYRLGGHQDGPEGSRPDGGPGRGQRLRPRG